MKYTNVRPPHPLASGPRYSVLSPGSYQFQAQFQTSTSAWVAPASTWPAPASTWTAPAAWSAPAQAPWFSPAQAPWFASNPVYPTQPRAQTLFSPPQAQTLFSPPQYQPSVIFSDFTFTTKPQTIYNNQGIEYRWQQQSDGNYAVLNQDRQELYVAMNVYQITNASEFTNGNIFGVTFTSQNGESTEFQGLRLGDFVYFNCTNQDIFVGGYGKETGFKVPPSNPLKVSRIKSQTYSSRVTRESESQSLDWTGVQHNFDLRARDNAMAVAETLILENTKLTNAVKRQFKLTQAAEAQAETARARADAQARAAQAQAEERALLFAEQRTRVAAAEARAKTAEEELAKEKSRTQALEESAKKAQADAERARDAEARADNAEREVIELKQTIYEKDQKINILQGLVISLKDGLNAVKNQLEKLTPFAVANIKGDQIIIYEETEKNVNGVEEYELKWKYDRERFDKELDPRFSMYSKMSAFKGDKNINSELQKQNEQNDITNITLLKLKIIALGMDKGDFESNKPNIDKYLSDLGIKSGDELEDDTKTFCEKYLKLGEQYKKILDDSDNKDALEKMMSDYFKKETLPLRNKNALEYKKLEPSEFVNKIKEASGFDFSTTESDQKDKIKFLSTFEIALKDACSGYEEIKKQTSSAGGEERQEFKITPEIAKVFIVLDEKSQNDFLEKIDKKQKQQLKVFVENEMGSVPVEKRKIEYEKIMDIGGFGKLLGYFSSHQEEFKITLAISETKKKVLESLTEKDTKCETALNIIDTKIKENKQSSPSFEADEADEENSFGKLYATLIKSVKDLIVLGNKVKEEEELPEPVHISEVVAGVPPEYEDAITTAPRLDQIGGDAIRLASQVRLEDPNKGIGGVSFKA